MDVKEVEELINFHQASLDQYRQFISSSVQRKEERTIEALRSLKFALEDVSKGTMDLIRAPNVENIIQTVCNSFGISLDDIKGRKRDNETAFARQVVMYLIRQTTDLSLAQVGKEIGGRAPATISYAYLKITNTMSRDSFFRLKITNIQESIIMKNTLYQRLVDLNKKIEQRTPGYRVEANTAGKFEWLLVGPDGKIHYTRDNFEDIEAVALR